MNECTIAKELKIVRGDISDYKQLARYHYREGNLGPHCAIFAVKADRCPGILRKQTVGVIVYTMPSIGAELRNIAMDGLLSGMSVRDRLFFVNKNIRNISRVVLEPRFRGIGLAARLVRETLALINVPIVEAMAVMGHVNPFFEKAGMKAYTGPEPVRCRQLIEAFAVAGTAESELIDPLTVQEKIDLLPKQQADFIEGQIEKFLQSYGRRRSMSGGIERTKYVLSKLTDRPVYYIWFNPNLAYSI